MTGITVTTDWDEVARAPRRGGEFARAQAGRQRWPARRRAKTCCRCSPKPTRPAGPGSARRRRPLRRDPMIRPTRLTLNRQNPPWQTQGRRPQIRGEARQPTLAGSRSRNRRNPAHAGIDTFVARRARAAGACSPSPKSQGRKARRVGGPILRRRSTRIPQLRARRDQITEDLSPCRRRWHRGRHAGQALSAAWFYSNGNQCAAGDRPNGWDVVPGKADTDRIERVLDQGRLPCRGASASGCG